MGLFDSLSDSAFDVVTNTMGYRATWTPQDNSKLPETAEVLYRGPTEKEKLLDANYDPDKLTLEYKHGVFNGLKESADGNNLTNVIRVFDLPGFKWIDFSVRSVRLLWDGNNYEARLELKELPEF